ncbi:MAG: rRNA maturation RNase YbeY [Dehalococcoidia bacterium]|nr:rRNA maturation RNase YbeY [Dehalococcoidia bacterium]
MQVPQYKVNIRIKRGLGFPYKIAEIRKVVEKTLLISRKHTPVQVDCLITDNPAIHRLNKRYRGMDSPTDVLSFNFTESKQDGKSIDFPIIPDYIVTLGQIIISYPKAVEQAAQHGNNIRQELQLLLVHGTLHLLGYDHMKGEEARKMRAQEKRVIKSIEAGMGSNAG